MSRLLYYREKLNLTQQELSERSGISVRTIQRIEAGNDPKGHTLKSLAKCLDIAEKDLLSQESRGNTPNARALTLINFCSLFFFIPFANILVPIIVMRMKNEVNKVSKQIISLQILWTASAILVIGISPFLVRWIGISRQWTLFLIVIFFILNLVTILTNAVQIQRKGRLLISPNFSFI